jgi:predicted RecB family nuclease
VRQPKYISKSRFCVGLQCLKRLWWEFHEPDAPELKPDGSLQVVFDRGHRVGELARERFGGGTLVDFEPWQVAERIEATAGALRAGADVVFEASFGAGGVFAALDVLEKRRLGYGLVEVKATLDAKPQFLPDIAVQLHAARASGLDVRRAELMHLNRACTYPDLDDLFIREDVTAEVEALIPSIPRQLRTMRTTIEGDLPDVAPGDHCAEPYDCPFAGRCHPEPPQHHLSTLYRLHPRRRAELAAAGFETIHDLPDDLELPPIAARQVRSVKRGRAVVERGLAEALRAIEAPVAFLDFETINPPVPAWNGCRPYQHVPVQMSCHVAGPRGGTTHHAHLAERGEDPRPALAAAVVRACDGARTVVAYNASFERGCLAHLADAVPSQQAALRRIGSKLVDLLPIVQEHVYHPAFGGSFSLKSVVPALVPELGYDALDIADGATASAALEALLLGPESKAPSRNASVPQQLLAYCERDTLALVRLRERLLSFAGSIQG